ncbi:Deoxyuridine 5'-triphosphate nucleotidohydrolase [Anaplasma phagocytophilum]|nr:Deoxyuridine 5'-triphosphate nucleotidohydrolase [Anaplasma phagocytophilum]SBO32835.1 Deoxyuridine 5'-triphosphate nucleotidohydrolase [Anaplasma phagocytophilum]SBO32957.1 Deoxyuridine 5'-triphosphate nucleotidohydrolase [Anaplasma phagocytophilum]SCV64249.1 Deoxyuridine 5'-triphosphate nucleotidohydrolase [Anaplasma phagocytophilum]SCV65905.1 Deoxyuridine 5'-triphosphate nucleotidohydrolase [Anaplasma phagocytophilum]
MRHSWLLLAYMKVGIIRMKGGEGLPLPSYATPQSAGLDLYAALSEEVVIRSGERCLIRTGVAIELPDGYEAQVRSRSGLAAKAGVIVLNSPGTIDADYRGEIAVILANFGASDYVVKHGDRIAQLVIAPVMRISWEESSNITETQRGAGGFGSTGV